MSCAALGIGCTSAHLRGRWRRSARRPVSSPAPSMRRHLLLRSLIAVLLLPVAGIARAQADRSKWVAAIMFPIGAEVGFSSAGAGALGTVALLSLTSLTAAQVVGTDLAFGLVIAVVGTGVHLIAGHYNSLLLAKLVAGGVVGGLVGSGAAPKIPNRSLRFALSLWLLFIGLQFCYQAAIK